MFNDEDVNELAWGIVKFTWLKLALKDYNIGEVITLIIGYPILYLLSLMWIVVYKYYNKG